jgi:K+-transporting ATPase ATPase C chain
MLSTSIRMMIFWTILCGLVYPLGVTGLAQLLFPHQANGSPLAGGTGSELIGQDFQSPGHFWGRLSATSAHPDDAASSSGSNWGPNEPKLADEMKAGAARYPKGAPLDLVTSSASGLDPDITPEAARFQIARVAKARKMDEAELSKLVEAHVQPASFGILGHARVNIVQLNSELDSKT